MSRISSNSFKVNSSLQQEIEISSIDPSVTIPISTASTLDQNLKEVNGSTIDLGETVMASSLPVVIASDQSAVATTNTDITSGADATLVSAQQVGIYGSNGGVWTPMAVNADGQVETVDIDNSHTGSQGNLDNGTAVVIGDVSTTIFTSKKTQLTIFGNHTNFTAEITPQVTADGLTYYSTGFGIYPDSNGDFFHTFENTCTNRFRLKYQGSGTVTATLLLSD